MIDRNFIVINFSIWRQNVQVVKNAQKIYLFLNTVFLTICAAHAYVSLFLGVRVVTNAKNICINLKILGVSICAGRALMSLLYQELALVSLVVSVAHIVKSLKA